jgi:hypothetical protein
MICGPIFGYKAKTHSRYVFCLFCINKIRLQHSQSSLLVMTVQYVTYQNFQITAFLFTSSHIKM